MEKKTREGLKAGIKELDALLESDQSLSPEERKNFERIRDQAVGAVMSTWLPVDWPRRMIMFALIAVGVYGMLSGNWLLAAGLLLAFFFSPRAVGTLLTFIALLRGDYQE